MWSFLILLLVPSFMVSTSDGSVPIVLNTWSFDAAAKEVWRRLRQGPLSAVDAVTIGCTVCEELQCDKTVGFGGSPDENGETTLDAMIFDGETMDVGAVACLRKIKNAIGVARHILRNTKHSILAGELASEFAKSLGFEEETLVTNYSTTVWREWKQQNCQPNFWKNVKPDPSKSCGPYQDISEDTEDTNSVSRQLNYASFFGDRQNHDTIGMIVIDADGNVATGTSSNGANHKIAGRVGDSPIPGAGAYADNDVGAAVATGDGDVMMRFLPSFLAVEEMRRGASPTKAASVAISRIVARYPDFMGAVLVADRKGEYGAACNGIDQFPFCVGSKETEEVVIKTIHCTGRTIDQISGKSP